MATGLWHTSHPFQFCTVQIIGTGYLRTSVVDTLLAFLQIIGVVAAIGIDGAVVKFQNHRADAIKEETVVSHHEQRLVSA